MTSQVTEQQNRCVVVKGFESVGGAMRFAKGLVRGMRREMVGVARSWMKVEVA